MTIVIRARIRPRRQPENPVAHRCRCEVCGRQLPDPAGPPRRIRIITEGRQS